MNHKYPSKYTELESYLSKSENCFADIKLGTGKKIQWNNASTKQKTALSIVYLHGFSASRQEISPVCETLATKLNANLYLTRLTGHGQTGEAMREITLTTLLEDANEAFAIGRCLGDKVIIVGTSTGATLATYLAAEHARDIHSLIFISPNFALKRNISKLLHLPFAKGILKVLQGDTYSFTPDNELQEKYWTTSYPSLALLPLMQLLKFTNKLKLEKIVTPLLCFYSEQDQVVSPRAIKNNFIRFGSPMKKLVSISNPHGPQKHILAGDIISPNTTQEVLKEMTDFLIKVES